ncbi:MAG TPA: tripartite tricarboxylate transporter substrate binding protein [Bordetella sp.]|nr:tripartite tricarboxylate transporter substrate binding protein [Bordetella sp.]
MKKTVLAASLIALCHIAPSHAENWPARPVSIILGFAPGGSADIAARIISEKLTKALGASFVVENRPGANGDIAATFVKHAAPDGYTLLFAPDAIVTSPAIRKTQYDPIKDFTPIAMVAKGPLVLVENPNTKAETVSQLIEMARANPSRFSFGSSGVGNNQHFAGEKFNAMTGLSLTHVPYKGGGQAISDLLADQIPIAFLGTGPVMPHVKSGKLKVLAVTTAQRFQGLPDVPTLAESGLTGFDMSQWLGIVGPVGTPREVIDKLNSRINKILEDSDVQEKLLASGMNALPMTPAQLGEQIKVDAASYKQLAKDQHMSE